MSRIQEAISRESILAAAAVVFSKTSFAEASMDVVASQLGSTKDTLYNFFESKADLFTQLIHHSAYSDLPSMMDILRKSGGFPTDYPNDHSFALLDTNNVLRTSLIAFGENFLNIFHTPQSLAIQRMVIAATINSDAGYTFFQEGHSKVIEHTQKFFAAHIENGSMHKTDARVAACHYYGLLQSEVYQAGIFNVVTSIQPSIAKIIVARAVHVFLKGYEQTTSDSSNIKTQ